MSYCTIDEAFSQPLTNLSNNFDKNRCKKNTKKSRINCNKSKTKFSENCYDTFDSLIKDPTKNSCRKSKSRSKSKSKSKSKKNKVNNSRAYDSDNLSQLLLENSDYGSFFKNESNESNEINSDNEIVEGFDNFYENFSDKKNKNRNEVFEYDKNHDRPIDEMGNIIENENSTETDEDTENDSETDNSSDEEEVVKKSKKKSRKSRKEIEKNMKKALKKQQQEIEVPEPSATVPSQIQEINSKINFLINQMNEDSDKNTSNSLSENNIHDIILFVLFGVFIIIILESLYKLVFKICRKKYLS